ncbi:AI-2E family transporter [Teredinibacter sp. KSP-S5-2]|uniref:AI-2E family transporter n=1 Tax=Teredinibacter sp. KSP-S5-2 TaxID=3034506 RepID=UPI0029351F1E|nr:AI-2E family transporter [Teredinibacter sp. KSP-S5-2]WNO10141.1 AI-2E family transporter [Teredinibacter sp. KSP-S5-2]
MVSESPIARFLNVMAAFVIVVAGMKAAESILVPFLLSLFIAVILTPPLMLMRSKGIPGFLSILIMIGVVVIVGAIIGTVVGASIADFRQDLPEYQARLQTMTGNLFHKLNSFGFNIDASQFKEGLNPSAALSLAGNTLASFGNLMTNALLIQLTVIFILVEEVGFREKIRFFKNSDKTLAAIEKFTSGVNSYMAIKSLMSLLTGAIVMVWLWILGVDYFVLWGLLAFLLNFVPTLGSILAAVPAVLLAVVQLGVGDAVLVAAGYLAVNFIVGNVLEPRVMGKGLDLSALVVFLSLVFWGWVLGPVGMLLSIPLTMTVKIALESFEDTRAIGLMLGSGRSILHRSEELEKDAEASVIKLPQMD